MVISLSTRWNAYRHGSGQAMIEEILELGVQHVELGYDLTLDLSMGVKEAVSNGAIVVDSVHNFCPVPTGAPMGHPELFYLCALDRRSRESAVRNTVKTIEFAAEVGARVVVAHAGRIYLGGLTQKLITLCEADKQYSPRYDKLKLKLLMKRERKVAKYIEALYLSLEELLPALDKADVCLALENLPSWETVPNEVEMETLCGHFDSPRIGYWHDLGHGQVRQNLGFISQRRWVERLAPYLKGMHVHSVEPPAFDHLMPPRGALDFEGFRTLAWNAGLAVMEPAPGTPECEVRRGIQMIEDAWTSPDETGESQ